MTERVHVVLQQFTPGGGAETICVPGILTDEHGSRRLVVQTEKGPHLMGNPVQGWNFGEWHRSEQCKGALREEAT